MCEPRLGTNASPPSRVGEARRPGRPPRRRSRRSPARRGSRTAVPAHEVVHGRADEPLAVEQGRLGAHPRGRDRAAGERRPEHRERQPGVVLDPVVVDDRAGQALAPEVRRVLDRARRPEVLREPAVAAGAQQVVQEDAAAVEALVEQRDAVDREEERLQASRGAARAGAAAPAPERLVDQAEVELLQVAQPAVDQARAAAGRARGDVPLLHQRRAQARGSSRPAARPTPTIPPPTTARRSARRRAPRAPSGARPGQRRVSPPCGRRPPALLHALPDVHVARLRSCPSLRARAGGGPRSATGRGPVPRISTAISSGVWKITRWASGREHGGENRRSQHDARRRRRRRSGPRASRRCATAQPRSASRGMPIGATRTLPASAAPRFVSRPGLRSMEGHGEVRANDGRRGVAGGQVDPRRGVDRDDGHLGRPGGEDQLDRRPDRVAQLALDARSEQRVDDDRRPLDVLGQHLQLEPGGGVDPRHARLRVEAVPVPRGVRGRRLAPSSRRGPRPRPHRRAQGGGPRRTRRRRCCRDRRGSGSGPSATAPSPPRWPSPPRPPPRPRAPSAAGRTRRASAPCRSAPVIASRADRATGRPPLPSARAARAGRARTAPGRRRAAGCLIPRESGSGTRSRRKRTRRRS